MNPVLADAAERTILAGLDRVMRRFHLRAICAIVAIADVFVSAWMAGMPIRRCIFLGLGRRYERPAM